MIQFGDSRLPARFWAKVQLSHYPNRNPDLGRCWVWTASRSTSGYGQFGWEGKVAGAHRLAYQILVGPIAEGLQCDHRCWCRYCVNPNHIRLATSQENTANMSENGRVVRARPGEANGNSKLTSIQIFEILRLYGEGGYTQREIGAMFLVSDVTISLIVRRENWSHLRKLA